MSRLNRPPHPSPAPAPASGAFGLCLLAALAGAATLVPLGGFVLGLLSSVLGLLAVVIAVPEPEQRPFLALSWSALALALPLTIVLARPDLALGASLALGAAGLWVLATQTAQRLEG